MSFNRSIGSKEFMNKRTPRSQKFQHVKTTLDTGCSYTKYMERLEEIQRNYRYQKDEIFKRLKVTTFAQLILQVASAADLNENDIDSESHDPGDSGSVVSDADLECLSGRSSGSTQASPLSDHQDARDKDVCCSERSTLLSVISGVGELNLNRKHQEMETTLVSSPQLAERPYPDCPYLLLDVRDRDQYDCCHIISAHSWPVAMLSRTMNPYTKDMLEYKNAAGRIVIVYDVDETVAIQAANIMCERGFENLFLLSGGLKVIAQKFPEGLTTGSIPTSCMTSPKTLKVKKSSVPPQPPPQAAEKRWRFTSDELAQIQRRLEESFTSGNANSRRSSRMSTSSSRPQASSARSRQSSSAASKDGGGLQSKRVWK